jgi:hypothetical protein
VLRQDPWVLEQEECLHQRQQQPEQEQEEAQEVVPQFP